MTSGAAQGGVVLLHGFGALPPTMWPMGATLRRAGFATLTPLYPSWRMPLDRIAERLERRAARFADRLDGPLHFVGHSMGGLVIRALLNRWRPASLGRVVLLGTPNGGSELADVFIRYRASRMVLGHAAAALVTARDAPLTDCMGCVDYPVGVIAGDRPFINGPLARMLPRPHDGKVSVAATHVDGEADHIVLPVTHMLLPGDAEVRRQALHFLRFGDFARPGGLEATAAIR